MNFELSIFNWLRKKGGRNFRKSLGVYHYKIGHLEYHKKPGVIPLHIKEKLKKDKSMRAKNKISELERKSPYPYGKFLGRKFIFDEKKMPFYNIPDLSGFTLKPYVSVHTPMIEKMQIDHLKKLNDYNINDNFGRFVEESSLEKERRLQLTGKLEEKRENKEEKAKIKQEINK